MSDITERARAAGINVDMHRRIGECVEDDIVKLNIIYATTQSASRSGRSPRDIFILREGCAEETDFGKAGDISPGWWAVHDGATKFFLSSRIMQLRRAGMN